MLNLQGIGAGDIGMIVTTLTTAVLALFVATVAMRRPQVSILMSLYQSWNDVYPTYRRMVGGQYNVSDLRRKYIEVDEFMKSDEWNEMRSVFAFYELLGTCVERRLIDRNTIFSLVSMEGELWTKYEELISWIRKEKGAHIYEHWQDLTEHHKKYNNQRNIRRLLRKLRV